MLYSDDLLRAVYKKSVCQRDISMKLKYLGKDELSVGLYIIVQCEERFAKKVKRFFAKDNVVEDLGQDFKIHIVKKGLQQLASSDLLQVYGIPSAASHPMVSFYRDIEIEALPAIEDDVSESLDEYEDENEEEEEILFHELDENYPSFDDDPFEGQEGDTIGTVLAKNIQRPVNLDWALITLDGGGWLPNELPHPDSSKSDGSLRPLYCNRVKIPFTSPIKVTVITSHGSQKGTLEANESSLFAAPSTRFVQTFDLKPDCESALRQGDSGSWVVDETTGEVFGYITSTDAFGEAHVIPMQDALDDIRTSLQASNVKLADEAQIETLQKSSLSFPSYSSDSGCDLKNAPREHKRTHVPGNLQDKTLDIVGPRFINLPLLKKFKPKREMYGVTFQQLLAEAWERFQGRFRGC
ncbi:hypothetical protein GQ53DRAFT_765387 [Thozetella sp. PMI_491]|nr:hypothetical protein GQ53DRAFT_765387 [Thozetella sp. PMI_491]